MEVDEYWVKRLESALVVLGMNQASLARKLGIKPQTLSDIKSGKRPGYKRLHGIANALGCSIEWLGWGGGVEPPWMIEHRNLMAGSAGIDPDYVKNSPGLAAAAAGHRDNINIDAGLARRAAERKESYHSDVDAETIAKLVNINADLTEQLKESQRQNTALFDRIKELEARIDEDARFHAATFDDPNAAEENGGDSSSTLPAG